MVSVGVRSSMVDAIAPNKHHKIAENQRDPIYLIGWLAKHQGDPAAEVSRSFIH